jgi:hypothetical protein
MVPNEHENNTNFSIINTALQNNVNSSNDDSSSEEDTFGFNGHFSSHCFQNGVIIGAVIEMIGAIIVGIFTYIAIR